MSDERDEIKARVSIVDLVGQSVALKRTGKTWKGLCPFHDDKNPSFTVSDANGWYQCWACGEKGDIFTWVMKTQNVEFPEALHILADRAGVSLKARPGERSKSLRQTHAAIMEEARTFFTQQLSQSDIAKSYLDGRGLDAGTVADWELGYAPDVDIALSTHLKKKGLPLPEAKTLFLVDADAGGGYFDKFRGRLMFPIRDERGELVAFGGRILGDGHPKYINSGDTPLFRKSRVLYGMYRAKDAVAKSGRAVLVEGYLDVIACHRAGVKTAVASLGTSLTEDHARLLKRWCEEVVVLYDGDSAGKKAAERAVELLTEAGSRTRVALLPEGQDPDTLLKTLGPGAVEKAAEEGLSPLEFKIVTIESKLKPDQEEFWKEIVAALAASDSLRAVEEQAIRLAQRYLSGQSLENARDTLLNDVRRAKRDRARPKQAREPAAVATSVPKKVLSGTEAVIFNGVLQEETRAEAWAIVVEDGLFQTEAGKELAECLRAVFGEVPPMGRPVEWLDRVESDFAREALLAADDPLHLANKESLATNLDLLRRARENRSAAEIGRGDKGDSALAEISAKLRAAAKHDPYRQISGDDKPPA